MHNYTKLKFEEAKVRYSKERNMEWAKRYSTGRNSTYGVLSFIEIGQEYINKLLAELFEAERIALLKEITTQSDNYFSMVENEIIALIEKEYNAIFNEIEKQHKIYGPDLIARNGQKAKSSSIESIHRRTQILQEELRLKIQSPPSSTTIHVTGDVGAINTGRVYGNIQVKLDQIKNSDMNGMVDAFEKLAAAISESGIDSQTQTKQMQALEFLVAQCEIPNENRNQGVIEAVAASLSVAANLSSVWTNVGQQILKSLGLN